MKYIVTIKLDTDMQLNSIHEKFKEMLVHTFDTMGRLKDLASLEVASEDALRPTYSGVYGVPSLDATATMVSMLPADGSFRVFFDDGSSLPGCGNALAVATMLGLTRSGMNEWRRM